MKNWLFLLLIVFLSPNVKAQTIVYPSSESNGYTGVLCLACSVTNSTNAVDNDYYGTYSTLNIGIGLAATTYQTAVFSSTQSGGRYAGVIIESPGGLIDVTMKGGISISTYLGGTLKETVVSTSTLVNVGLLPGTNKYHFEFPTTLGQDFNRIRISISALIGALDGLRFYSAFSDVQTLGINLIEFKEKHNAQGKVTLNWMVAKEDAIASYAISRSDNGGAYKIIQNISVNPSQNGIYQSDDQVKPSGFYSYKISTIDHNNIISDLDKKIVRFNGASINPNILIRLNEQNQLEIDGAYLDNEQNYELTAIDLTGKIILNDQFLNNGLIYSSKELNHSGIVLIQLKQGSEVIANKKLALN